MKYRICYQEHTLNLNNPTTWPAYEWCPIEVNGQTLEVYFDRQHSCVFYRHHRQEPARKIALRSCELTVNPDSGDKDFSLEILLDHSHGFIQLDGRLIYDLPGQKQRAENKYNQPAIIKAPMTGTLLKICVQPSQAVKKNDVLCIIEAMKMENNLFAPRDGIIEKVFKKEGDNITVNEPLFQFT